MNSNSMSAAYRIFDLLVNGRRVDREAAIAALDDPAQTVDRSHLRQLILDAISQKFYPRREDLEEDEPFVWVRTWLLSSLARVSDGDSEAAMVVRNHLDPGHEPNPWVRYWALEGLISAGASDLEELARKIEKEEENPLVRKLAVAVLASKGDSKSKQEIQEGLNNPELQWATLRALRVVPIPATIKRICEIVGKGRYSDEMYDAIFVLGQIPSGSPHAESATQVLISFVRNVRHSPWLDGMRTRAIIALGNLRIESAGPLLVEELRDGNPTIVREAALALEKVLGIRTACARIIEAAGKAGQGHIEGFANAVRWMNRDSVVEELEAAMISGSADQQETARILLSEIGGMAAFQKLRARTKSITQYTTELEKAEEKIRRLFETSIEEARRGFSLATLMDVIVFFLGIGLLAISAGIILFKGGTLNSWVGIGLTGGTGVLGVVYGILIAKPRHQIQEAVDHLMYLKVIFLAYLRQLHQADQAYTRRLLEDKPLSSQEIDEFSKMVETTMRIAIEQLTLSKPPKPEDEPKAKGKDAILFSEEALATDIKK